MAKNYFNRYVWLIDTILNHGYITFSDLSDLWQRSALNEDGLYLPERTFFNHRQAVKEIFGIEIKFDKPLGYYIACDDQDVDALRQWLFSSLSINNLLNETAGMRERILFENIPSGQTFLHTIIDAMKEHVVLEMTYQKFTDEEAVTSHVSPYCIKLFKQRWYMAAKSARHRDVRIYALDRMQMLRRTRKTYTIPDRFNAAEYFANYFGIVHDEQVPVQKIRLKVYDKQRHYFRTLPLHASQTEVDETPEWSIFEYIMAPTWDLEQELLQYSDQVEVLEPRSLRDMMIEHAWNMLHGYNEL